jgi:hypothetical protein
VKNEQCCVHQRRRSILRWEGVRLLGEQQGTSMGTTQGEGENWKLSLSENNVRIPPLEIDPPSAGQRRWVEGIGPPGIPVELTRGSSEITTTLRHVRKEPI